jgi:hypothetical protein
MTSGPWNLLIRTEGEASTVPDRAALNRQRASAALRRSGRTDGPWADATGWSYFWHGRVLSAMACGC